MCILMPMVSLQLRNLIYVQSLTHPGIVSGFVGAAGNFGGIIFAIIFRYNGTHYARVLWIMGIIIIALNLTFSWVRPIPKGQIGGR
jgi:NNP family nitrate/nitrite transporter-like MFS transporter